MAEARDATETMRARGAERRPTVGKRGVPWRFGILAFGLLALTALLPRILSLAACETVVEALLGAHLGFAVDVGDARLRWTEPALLRDVAVAGPRGFGGVPLFEARLVRGICPLRGVARQVAFEAPRLRVVRAPNGAVNLALALRPWSSAWRPVDVVVTGGALEVHDARTGARASLADAGVEMRHDSAGTHVRVDAAVEGSRGRGRLAFDAAFDAAMFDATLDAGALQLADFEPLAAALLDGARIAGAADVTMHARRDRASLAWEASGRIEGLSIEAPGLLPQRLADDVVALAGQASFGGAHLAEFDGLRIDSSLVQVHADGTLDDGDHALEGPLRLQLGVNLDRLARAGGGLFEALLPIGAGAGELEVRVNGAGAGYYAIDASTKGASAVLGGRHAVATGEATLSATARVQRDAASGATIDVTDLAFDGREVRVTGNASFATARGRPFAVDLHFAGDHEQLAATLQRWSGAWPARGSGFVDAHLKVWRFDEDDDLMHAVLHCASEDLDLEITRAQGHLVLEQWSFRGRPFEATAEAQWNAREALPAATATLRLDAQRADLDHQPVEDFRLEMDLSRGVARTRRCEAGGFGGTLSAAVEVDLTDPAGARWQVAAQGDDLRIEGHAQELAARVAPIFAPVGGPERVVSACRMAFELHGSGRGATFQQALAAAEGGGSVRIGAGSVAGSPLLDRLVPGATSIEGARANFRFVPAGASSETIVDLVNGALRFEGDAGWDGRLRFDGIAPLARSASSHADAGISAGGTVLEPEFSTREE